MDIFMKNLNEIKPYEKNPRRNDDAVKYVAASIKEFGFKVPIIIDKDGVIVAGHTRYKAAKNLNIEQVPCIVADDLTEEQIKAFRLADNKTGEMAAWDFEMLQGEIEELLDFNMQDFGFVVEDNEIDWDNVGDISEENYEEPAKTRLRCPKCNHVDMKIHFIKVEE